MAYLIYVRSTYIYFWDCPFKLYLLSQLPISWTIPTAQAGEVVLYAWFELVTHHWRTILGISADRLGQVNHVPYVLFIVILL